MQQNLWETVYAVAMPPVRSALLECNKISFALCQIGNAILLAFKAVKLLNVTCKEISFKCYCKIEEE